MKCQKICDLLKSDYLDGELNAELRREIDKHLAHCPGCRSLKEKLDSQRIALRGLEQQQVPAQIWENIQKSVLQEQLAPQKKLFDYLGDSLRRTFLPSRPAFALAASLAVLIIALFVGKIILSRPSPLSTASSEDIFIDYRLNGIGEIYNFGTEIEEYFL
jgi:anti-sigma factor RsiW